VSDNPEDLNSFDSSSDINLDICSNHTRTNDTIIIHKNKITFDKIIEMEELQNFLSMSTNNNTVLTNSIKNEINNYLNYMDIRGNIKNLKNLKKIKKISQNPKILENKKGKSNSDIHYFHKKILSNILTSKDFLNKCYKKKDEKITHKTQTKDLDKTLVDDNNSVIAELSSEEEICDEMNRECNVVNKVKDFQEEYLIRNKMNLPETDKKCDDPEEEKDLFNSNQNKKEAEMKLVKKRLYKFHRNKNIFTFNPNKATSKITEEKFISLIKYNLENKNKENFK